MRRITPHGEAVEGYASCQRNERNICLQNDEVKDGEMDSNMRAIEESSA